MVRRNRFKRDPLLRNAHWVYRPVDEKILLNLAEFRYLRGTSLYALIDETYPCVKRAIRKLYDRGLIDKPSQQHQGYNTLNDTDIYEITDLGRARLAQEVPQATNLLRKHKHVSKVNFPHSMMICDAISSIKIGAQGHGYRFIPQGEIVGGLRMGAKGNPLEMSCIIRHKGQTATDRHIKPDGFFGLVAPDGSTRYFFVETERGNPVMPASLERSSFLKKIVAYKSVEETGSYRSLGIEGFTVLFIFQTKGEMAKPKQVIEELFIRSNRFWLNHIPVVENIRQAPKPKPELFTGTWQRGGLEPGRMAKETPKP